MDLVLGLGPIQLPAAEIDGDVDGLSVIAVDQQLEVASVQVDPRQMTSRGPVAREVELALSAVQGDVLSDN